MSEHELPQRSFNDYVEIPLRRPWRVLIPTVLLTCGAVAFSYSLSEMYESSTFILVEAQKVPDSVVTDMAPSSIADRMQTVKQEILSRTRLERVLEEQQPYPDDGHQSISSLVEKMREDVRIATKGRDAFILSYVHPDPAMAQRVADSLATLFIQDVSRSRARQVTEASDFIASQVEEAALVLEAKEKTLRAFKERHMGSLPDQLGANLSTLQRLQLEDQAASESLRGARDRLVLVEQNLAAQIRTASMSGTDPAAELSVLQSELATLRARYTEQHPDVQTLLERIVHLKEALATAPPSDVANGSDPTVVAARQQHQKAALEVEALVEQKAAVQKRMAQIQWRVDQVPAREQELLSLTREYEQLQLNYNELLAKKMAADMAARLEQRWKGAYFRILDPASMPERPVSPNRLLFLIVGLIGGLSVGLGLAVAGELLDHSIKNVNELEALFASPVLASIPPIEEPPSGWRGRFRAILPFGG
jgi:polysaccharide chain length determinant protein (PEP-CTERM system associated)